MNILIEISIGEFLDKLSILKIKLEKILDDDKKLNVAKEYELYAEQIRMIDCPDTEVESFLEKLKKVNLTLWEIEDQIRGKENNKEFDEEFIALARSVYKTNDLRAKIKRQVNEQLKSGIIEEKSYKNY